MKKCFTIFLTIFILLSGCSKEDESISIVDPNLVESVNLSVGDQYDTIKTITDSEVINQLIVSIDNALNSSEIKTPTLDNLADIKTYYYFSFVTVSTSKVVVEVTEFYLKYGGYYYYPSSSDTDLTIYFQYFN